MNPTIVAAIIGGVFVVISPIVTFLLTRYVDNRDKNVMYPARRAAISGKWTGTMSSSDKAGNSYDVPVTVTFETSRKIVTGECLYESQHQKSGFKFKGGFLHDRFFQVNYISKNENRMQFGSAILELRASGDTISGKYTGFGAVREEIVSGNIEIKRLT